ncbi:MAG: hypothetical protein QM652_12620 [Legionella sp.]|uniref:hypothetical protein n=1 Tax=Legionella sp. TaxID=459 RepID=UPI0039E5100F
MGWWSSIGTGMKWAWDKGQTPLAITTTYAANTMVQVYNQGIALKSSIPGLTTPENLKVVKAVSKIFIFKMVPLLLLNAFNSYLQRIIHEPQDDNAPLWQNNIMVLSGATLINWSVWFYTQRESVTLLVETMAIDMIGPIAATAHLDTIPRSPNDPCEINHCNFKRRLKGNLREFFSLFAIDATAIGISYIPYVGKQAAFIFSLYSHGNVIVHAVKYNINCAWHRSTDSETILVLGTTYTLTDMLIKYMLEHTVGSTPIMVHKSLNHIMVLGLINNAAHMPIRYVKLGEGTLAYDPFFLYERGVDYVIDRIFAWNLALLKTLFRPNPEQPSLIFTWILKSLKSALDSDLEKVEAPQPGFFASVTRKIRPPVTRNAYEFVSDPVLRIFWADFHAIVAKIVKIINSVGHTVNAHTKVPVVATATSNGIPYFLHQKYGISPRITSFLIELCKQDDFLALTHSLNEFVKRLDPKKMPKLPLLPDNLLYSLHESKELPPVAEDSSKTHASIRDEIKRNPVEVIPKKNHEVNAHYFLKQKSQREVVNSHNFLKHTPSQREVVNSHDFLKHTPSQHEAVNSHRFLKPIQEQTTYKVNSGNRLKPSG